MLYRGKVPNMRLLVLTVMKTEDAVFWVVTLCSNMVGYQCTDDGGSMVL
jgi:hypothetical protein